MIATINDFKNESLPILAKHPDLNSVIRHALCLPDNASWDTVNYTQAKLIWMYCKAWMIPDVYMSMAAMEFVESLADLRW